MYNTLSVDVPKSSR